MSAAASPIGGRAPLTWLELSPVAAALGFWAIAHGRWILALPLALALLLFRLLPFRGGYSEYRLLAAGAVGGLAGIGLSAISPAPPSPLPPLLLSGIGAFLAAATVFCAAVGERSGALGYAWVLAILCCNAEPSRASVAALALLGATSLAAIGSAGGVGARGLPGLRSAIQGQPSRSGIRGGVLAFLLFAACSVAGAGLTGRLMFASEGWLMLRVAAFWTGGGAPAANLLVDLPARATAGISLEPIFAIGGTPPERLRLSVLDRFSGRRWSASPTTEPRPLPGGAGARLLLRFFAPTGGALPAPAGLLAASGEGLAGLVSYDDRWLLSGPELAGSTLALERGTEELPQETRAGGEQEPRTALPAELRAELAPLAADLLAGRQGAREKAAALEQHFRTAHLYSLEVDLTGRGHPLAVLIRERRPASCTYFAGAMAALLLASGERARLVLGYVPGEPPGVDGWTLVRARDAHAWVEVWLPEESRWRAFDPTPWQTRDAALQVDRNRSIAARLWSTCVARGLGAWSALRYRPGEALLALLQSPWTLGLVLLAGAWVFGRRILGARGGRRGARVADPVDPELERAVGRYLRALAGAGLQRRADETDDELLGRIREALGPGPHAAAARFVERYRGARFAGEASARGSAGQLETLLQQLSSALEARP